MGDMGYQYSSDIKVVCDLFRKTNIARHHTEEYVNSCLVLRRGDFIMLGMRFEGIDLSDAFNVKLRLSMGELKNYRKRKEKSHPLFSITL